MHIAPDTCIFVKEAVQLEREEEALRGAQEESSSCGKPTLQFKKEDMSKRIVEETHSEGWEVWYAEAEAKNEQASKEAVQ